MRSLVGRQGIDRPRGPESAARAPGGGGGGEGGSVCRFANLQGLKQALRARVYSIPSRGCNLYAAFMICN